VLCILPPITSNAETNKQIKNKTDTTALTLEFSKLNVTEKAFEISYQIKNDSEQDIWLCKDLGSAFRTFEVSMADDDETLLVRRRLDVPINGFGEHAYGSYIRIPKADRLKETILIPLPIRPVRIIMPPQRNEKVVKHVKQIMIEIGFFSGDTPGMILHMLEEAERNLQKKHVDDIGYPTDVIGWLVSSVIFNGLNERVPDRNEQIVIPWTNQAIEGEQVLRATVENLHVPYIEVSTLPEFKLESLNLCTKVEITYRPSMLEYLFPYFIQRSVLNSDEKKYLQSQEKIVVKDRTSINTLIHEIGKGDGWGCHGGYIFTDCSTMAHVYCYQGDKLLTSFIIYDDKAIVTEEKQCYRYLKDLTCIKILTSQVQQVMPFRLRVEYAANLRKLWRRLRLYQKAENIRLENSPKENHIVYPTPDKWCDEMLQAFEIEGSEEYLLEAYTCPSVRKGKSHYAINSNCKYDSPSDIVLLFETKSGWNQHGGPDLLTFDNHDPKGGCVLLNDGTIKFIRTKEEFQQLRWK